MESLESECVKEKFNYFVSRISRKEEMGFFSLPFYSKSWRKEEEYMCSYYLYVRSFLYWPFISLVLLFLTFLYWPVPEVIFRLDGLNAIIKSIFFVEGK